MYAPRREASRCASMHTVVQGMLGSPRIHLAQWVAFVGLAGLAAKKAADVTRKAPLAPPD